MKTVTLPTGKQIPKLGQGTYHMGRDFSQKKGEIAALRRGVELGMTLIDTAELYDDAESVIGEGLSDLRKSLYYVSKVMPSNASRKGTIQACERSLKKLKTDFLDLYLLHWRGSYPLEETFEAFQELKSSGKILDFGVSNFDVEDMDQAIAIDGSVATNQVYYNVQHRGIEYDLLPWCKKHRLPIMAYTPVQLGELHDNPLLEKIAKKHHATPIQIALAWVLRDDSVMAIPKSSNISHVEENFKSLEIKLTPAELESIDAVYPPPTRKQSLETL